MNKKSRQINSFNLAFLDIMFCGFGAVVLLVLIINSHIVSDNKIKQEQLLAKVERLKKDKKAADLNHQGIQQQLKESEQEAGKIYNQLSEINNNKISIVKKNSQNLQQSQQLKQQIKNLQNNIKSIDNNISKKKASGLKESGQKVRQYEGDGHRQYLTGLKLGGKRVLILLDNSASMLDETIVNIIIKRNMSDAVKRSARKWQQAVNSVKWMVANLPKNSQFLIVNFNKKISSLAANQSYQWIKVSNHSQVNALFNSLMKLVPENGTNLSRAFFSIKKLSPRPDNVILITDGLPTVGLKKTNQSKVSPAERVQLFEKAIALIPSRIPVNTILLPMEGDPLAAALFWKLAIDTKGSFMTPSRDWP